MSTQSELDWHALMICRHIPYIHMAQVQRSHPLYSLRKVTPAVSLSFWFWFHAEGSTVSIHFHLHSNFWFSEEGENVSDHYLFGFNLVDTSLGFGPCTRWVKILGGTSRQ